MHVKAFHIEGKIHFEKALITVHVYLHTLTSSCKQLQNQIYCSYMYTHPSGSNIYNRKNLDLVIFPFLVCVRMSQTAE